MRNLPLVKISDKVQIALYLITEELKTRKLFQALQEVGLDDCYFQPHLDSLIMRNIGLDDGKDETFIIYTDIMDKRARKIEADRESIMKQALKVYHDLTNEKKRLNKR
jgi:glutamine synthetase